MSAAIVVTGCGHAVPPDARVRGRKRRVVCTLISMAAAFSMFAVESLQAA